MCAVACSVDLQVPPGLAVSCTSDAECPADAQCNPLTQQCDFNVGNSAPAVAFRQVGPASGRAATTATIAIDAIDFNAPPVGQDVVTFTLEFSRDGATWCPATMVGAPAQVRAETTPISVVWDAMADAQAAPVGGPCALATAQLSLAPEEGAATSTVLAFTDGIRLRLTAVDSAVPPAQGQSISPVFAVGNDAPLMTLVDDGAAFRQSSPFEYNLVDSSLDEARLEVQFRIEGPTPSPWYTAAVRGSTEGVLADPVGSPVNRLLVWLADAPLPTDATTAGGIGRANARVTLRARPVEGALADGLTYGAWATLATDVFNQSPPVIGAVEVTKVENGPATSLVFVSYEVIDAERDDVDIRVERSIGTRDEWAPATPYPLVMHSGLRDLATDTVSPPRHVFVWDVGADFAQETAQVVLRLTAADDGGPSVPAIVAVPFDVGVTVSPALLYPVAESSAAYTADTGRDGTMLATGDFDGNGIIDYVVWAGGILQIFDGEAGGGIGTQRSSNPGSYHSRDLLVADLNGDGRDDLVARSELDDAQILMGSPTGLAAPVSLATNNNGFRAQLAACDVDGNGTLDLIANDNANVDYYPGNGNGTFATRQTFGAGGSIIGIDCGDFDGDGRGDIAYLVKTGVGIGDIIRFIPIELRVCYGAQSGSPPFVAGYEALATGVAADEDGNGFTRADVLVGDVRGDGRAELMFVDMQQSNVSRVRVFGRDATWTLHGELRNLRVARGIFFHKGAPGVITLTSRDFTQGLMWDRSIDRLVTVTSEIPDPANDFAFADLDGDGVRDLMVATETQLQWRPAREPKGVPAGGLDLARQLVIPDFNVCLAIGDNEGDGLADVLTLDSGRNSSHVAAAYHADALRDVPSLELREMGIPSFTVPDGTFFGNPLGGAGVGDFDGDGLLDVAITNYGGAGNVLSFGTGAPFAFGVATNHAPGVTTAPAFIGDFDGDGRDDLLAPDVGRVFYARVPPRGGPTPWQSATISLVNVDRYAVGDVDNDGIEDWVAIGTQLSTYFGNAGTGLGTACTTALGGMTGTAVAVGDVDGDGRNEIVASTTTSGLRVWRVSRCAYTQLPSSSSLALTELRLADIDGDGALDVTGWTQAGTTRAYYALPGLTAAGRPSGLFGAAQALGSTTTSIGDLQWGDINRDGLPEMFASTNNRLDVYGSHRFQAVKPWTVALDVSAVLGPPPPADRFGAPWTTRLVARRTLDRATSLTKAGDSRSSFTSRLRQSGQALPSNALAASYPWWFDGGFSADAFGTGADREVRVRPTPAIDAREVVITLPLYDTATTDVAKLLVYGRVVDAYETTQGVAPSLGDGRTVFRPIETWLRVEADADGNLATGTGPRFVVDPPSQSLRIATDRTGVFRAYAIP